MNTYTNTDTSRTPCSIIKHYCKYKGFMCEYANENGYCRLTACAHPDVVYRGSTIVKTRILKESELCERLEEEVQDAKENPQNYTDKFVEQTEMEVVGIAHAYHEVYDIPSAELPKGDLISRADVLKYPIRLDHYDEENGSREFVYGVESVIEYVESLPAVSANRPTDDDDIKDRQIKQLAHDVVILEKQLADRPTPNYITESANDVDETDDEVIERPIIEHDREWIIGCIKHDGFIKTDRFDKANQIIVDALESADRPSGEWQQVEVIDDDEPSGVNTDASKCSVCGVIQQSHYWVTHYYNYCPSCGAYMGKKGGAE